MHTFKTYMLVLIILLEILVQKLQNKGMRIILKRNRYTPIIVGTVEWF